eukprot:3992160-Lingulodinium_polyedra.AAC.1
MCIRDSGRSPLALVPGDEAAVGDVVDGPGGPGQCTLESHRDGHEVAHVMAGRGPGAPGNRLAHVLGDVAGG